MKATQTITLRVPSAWQSLASADVRSMLATYLQRPTPNLPADPGPGDARLSLSLPARAVKVVSALLNENESAALRRIIAASRGLPLAAQVRLLPVEHSHPPVLEAAAVRPKPRALLSASGDNPPPGWEPQADCEWRKKIWATFSPEYKAQLLGQPAPPAGAVPRVQAAPKPLLVCLWEVPELRVFFFIMLLICGLAYFFGGALRHMPSDSAKPQPGPRFRSWSPQNE